MTSWLFTNSDESIYIVRPPECSLTIYGPGKARQQLDFADETALQQYQMSMAERLAATGWITYAIDGQRRVRERRATRRGTADRRTP